jgi:hypothetical protein
MTARAKPGVRKPAPKRSAVKQAERGLASDKSESGEAPESAEEGSTELTTATASPPAAGEETAETCADTPLDYMLRVMRDPAVEPARRDEMAKLALPYLHPKPTAIEHTGKDGGPIEISDVSETDIARRIGFIFAQDAQRKAGH